LDANLLFSSASKPWTGHVFIPAKVSDNRLGSMPISGALIG
jgi:hypothetical protein